MKLSNLHKFKEQDLTGVAVDIECDFTDKNTLWFKVDSKYSDWLSDDTYDAFLVSSIYMAMYYNESIEIDGYVSKNVYRNICKYIMPVINSLNPAFKVINIEVKGFRNPEKNDLHIVGTGFSGGVDSFSTIIDNYVEEADVDYKINTLFFFNVGQYKGANHRERLIKARQFYDNSNLFAREVGFPYVFVDSNLFEFYLPEWEYDAGPLCRSATILALQKAITRYYISGSNHYIQQNSSIDKHLDDVTDEFIYTMLSPIGIEIILDGNQYYRSQKVERLIHYAPAHRHLNVCVNSNINVLNDKNCSICHKCCRTLIVLEALGVLNEFSEVFNLPKYKRQRKEYICWLRLDYNKGAYATENINFAKSHGLKIPGYWGAWLYLLPKRALRRIKSVIKR